jgi:hypothetical protein
MLTRLPQSDTQSDTSGAMLECEAGRSKVGVEVAPPQATCLLREPIFLDLDTTCLFPCHASGYLHNTLAAMRSPEFQGKGFAPCFRIVHAAAYLQHFSSDRSHMLCTLACTSVVTQSRHDVGTSTGAESYLAPPPAEPCIRGVFAHSSHTLPRYLDMVADQIGENDAVKWHELDRGAYGSVLSLTQMLSLCDVPP